MKLVQQLFFTLSLSLIVVANCASSETRANAGSSAVAMPVSNDRVYTFGAVPQFEQRKLYQIWRPILDEIERRTKLKFRLIGAPKIPAFEKKFMLGTFDFSYMNPYHAVLAYNSQYYLPLVRDGGRTLKGILVVRKNGPIDSIEQLRDKKIAFPAPNAISASLLIRQALSAEYGVSIDPIYVQTHSSVYLHVFQGKVLAGGGVLSTLKAQPEIIRNNLKVLYTTTELPQHPIVAHARVTKEVRQSVKNALLAMAKTKEGKLLLSHVPIHQLISADYQDYKKNGEMGLEKFYADN